MPVDKQVLLRYQVLNRCFRNRYREFTIDDLVEECSKAMRQELDMNAGISKRTVQNDIANLETDYHIRLDENLRRGRQRLYRYVDTEYTLPLVRLDDTERHKLQDAIYVLGRFEGEPLYDWARTLLMQIQGGLLDEDAKPVASFQSNPDYTGLSHFSDLLQAIIHKRVLKLRYKPFGKDTITDKIYPYYLKQFNDRWYLIAQAVGYDTYAHYALDRIEDFEEISLKYKEPDVDFNEYFDDVIGVTVPEQWEPVDVLLRIRNHRYNYIKTKPLHLTQREVGEEEGYTRVTINVKINKELIALLLSFGSDVEVLSPASLRTMMKKEISAMSYKYCIDEENLHG